MRQACVERPAGLNLSGPDGSAPVSVLLSGARATVGRLAELNDIALQPDPQLVVTRAGHCAFELEGTTWYYHRLWPARYWQVWSDYIIHTIHLRVLHHVKKLSERPEP